MSGTRNVLSLVLISIGFSATAAVLAQAPQTSVTAPGNGAITGTVVDSTTDAGVSGAIVQIEGGPLRGDYHVRQITDARGRFAFLRLANAGTYRISVTKFGYLGGGYGREATHTDPLRNITVQDGAWIQNLRVPIFRPGEISGVVRDEAGAPVIGVYVRAYGRAFIAGHERLVAGPMTVTDDRGHYRLGRLLPGRYVVQVPSVQMSAPSAAASNLTDDAALAIDEDHRLIIGRYPLPPPSAGGARMAYPPAFHPRAIALANADTVTIDFGESRTGVDITLTPVRAVTVSGRVAGPPEALVNLTVRLVAQGMERLGLGSESASAFVAPDGTFRFLSVPSGDYTLEAPLFLTEPMLDPSQRSAALQLPQPLPRTSWRQTNADTSAIQGGTVSALSFRGDIVAPYSGRMRLAVGSADVSSVTLAVERLSTVSGRIVVDPEGRADRGRPPLVSGSSVTLDSADGRGVTGPARLIIPSNTSPGVHRVEPQARIGPNAFEIPAVEAGQYWIRVGGWLIKSVTWRGRDTTTSPLDVPAGTDVSDLIVTVTTQGPTIAGVVRAPDGSNPGATAVVVFPADRAARVNTGVRPATLVSAVAGDSGSFWVAGMPAGDFLVAAIPQRRLHDWQSPARLDELERFATRVPLRWGQTVTVDLIRGLR